MEGGKRGLATGTRNPNDSRKGRIFGSEFYIVFCVENFCSGAKEVVRRGCSDVLVTRTR